MTRKEIRVVLETIKRSLPNETPFISAIIPSSFIEESLTEQIVREERRQKSMKKVTRLRK